MLCRRHLGAGQPGCVTEGAVSLLPTHGDPGAGGQLLLLSLTPGKLSPALLTQMLYPSSAAPKLRGGGQNCCVPHTLQPLWLHPVVAALFARFKASERGKVCAACPLHLLWVFSGLRAAERCILLPPSPSCLGLLHQPCAGSPKLPGAPGHTTHLPLL